MVSTTLTRIRSHIETLASEDGEYVVRCSRTGERPVPVSGHRFSSRTSARNAARAAEQYRSRLRRYDSRVSHVDLIVCQERSPLVFPGEAGLSATAGESTRQRPVETATAFATASEPLVEFCHGAAAAVFETLSDGDYAGVETAVLDAYFELVETIHDPDGLCRRLLERTAMELDSRLSPRAQATVLAGAADQLRPVGATDRPVRAALSALEDSGLLGGYRRSPWSAGLADGRRSIVVQLSEYALAPQSGRLPVLPIVLELYRRRPDWQPASLRVGDVDAGWQLTLVCEREPDPAGLASAPIEA